MVTLSNSQQKYATKKNLQTRYRVNKQNIRTHQQQTFIPLYNGRHNKSLKELSDEANPILN